MKPRLFSRPRELVGLLLALAMTGVAPQDATRLPLNSERIAAQFGSYGIEVLDAADSLRVSNLFSESGGERTTRTFAVVEFPARVDPSVAAEHAEILAGGSIGAVLAAAGWQVDKRNRMFTSVAATEWLAAAMRIPAGTPLAVHVYALEISRGATHREYAVLAEVHHPAYLTTAELRQIYGAVPALTATEQARAERLLAATENAMRRE